MKHADDLHARLSAIALVLVIVAVTAAMMLKAVRAGL